MYDQNLKLKIIGFKKSNAFRIEIIFGLIFLYISLVGLKFIKSRLFFGKYFELLILRIYKIALVLILGIYG